MERRRNMTEAERDAEDARLGVGAHEKKAEKPKWRFMQKYYHKGAFYMDEESAAADDVRRREADEATGEDKFNRAALPSVMQVKKFGTSACFFFWGGEGSGRVGSGVGRRCVGDSLSLSLFSSLLPQA